MTTKKSENVYEFSLILPRSHPSDDARMKMLAIALRKIGLGNKASAILSKWNEIPLVANTQPVTEYQYAYPDDLMNELADLFLNSLKAAELAQSATATSVARNFFLQIQNFVKNADG